MARIAAATQPSTTGPLEARAFWLRKKKRPVAPVVLRTRRLASLLSSRCASFDWQVSVKAEERNDRAQQEQGSHFLTKVYS